MRRDYAANATGALPRFMNVLMAESTHLYGAIRVGSHAYARMFADDGHRVMWVGTPIYPHNLIGARDAAMRHRMRAWLRGGHQSDAGVIDYYPFTLLPAVDRPLFRSTFAARNTLRVTVPPAASVIRNHGFGEPDLLWLSQSRFSYPLWRAVAPRQTAYRISDDWAQFDNVPSSLLRLETELIDEVDVVFATSHRLVERVGQRRDGVVYLPNAVDGRFFEDEGPEPDFLALIPRPRVVFVGTLGPWVNADLIESAARSLPNVNFCIVGPTAHGWRISPPANVHLLGFRPFEQIPSLLRHCDVAIAPHRHNKLTESMNPVKVFQYLATGIPTVGVRLDELVRSGAPAVLAGDEEAFIDAVSGFADGTLSWDAEAAVSFAREHTWERRFEVVKESLRLPAGTVT